MEGGRWIPFTKMVGAGNDFLIVDARRGRPRTVTRGWPSVSRALCDRRHGVGADGLLVVERSRSADARMRVFNPDGSEAGMCGNGARCVARWLRLQHRKATVTIETAGGLLAARVEGSRVRMGMPEPRELRWDLRLEAAGRVFRATHINTGVPHAIVPVDALETLDVERFGRALRSHRMFAPRGTNVDFVRVDPRRPNRLQVRTYERGVEAETPACGTGVAASAVVHALREADDRNGAPRTYQVEVATRSGHVLAVSCTMVPEGRGRRVTDVMLEGPANIVYHGRVEWPLEGAR